MCETVDWHQITKGAKSLQGSASSQVVGEGCRKRVVGRPPNSIWFDLNRNLENDERCKLTLIIAKVYITSLNSHFAKIEFGTRYGFHPT